MTGIEIVISHPRFYWGELGNVHTPSLFTLPIPASRGSVPTGYGFVLPDQNGWSRYLHFRSAWLVVLTGLLYGVAGLFTGHFRKDLLPKATAGHFHFRHRVKPSAPVFSMCSSDSPTCLSIFLLFPS